MGCHCVNIAKTYCFYPADALPAIVLLFFLTNHAIAQTGQRADRDSRFRNDSSNVTASKGNSPTLYPSTAERRFIRQNLGVNVNTRYEDLNPVISPDGKTLYFGRKKSPDNTGGKTDPQDIWVTTSIDGRYWSKSKNLGPTVNTPYADNLCAVSADNKKLVLYKDHQNRRGSFVYRNLTPSGWSAARPMGIDIQNESQFLESSLSADGNVLVFTAKNKDNVEYQEDVEERDIFVVVKKKNGTWSRPVNLGPSINTPQDELSPFLAADLRTLYFASTGHKGYGDADIFMSRRIGDGWTQWTEPVNLGPEINSRGFDAYYTLPATSDIAYMVSSHGGYGKSDIIRVVLPEEIKPDPVAFFRGRVLHANTKAPVTAQLLFSSNNSYSPTHITTSAEGDFSLTLPLGTNQHIEISAKGFIASSHDMIVPKASGYIEMERVFLLMPLEIGRTFQLEHVLFEEAKAVLTPESSDELHALARIMKENENLEVELRGHTDNRGTDQQLLALSQARTETVKRFLTENGISPRRIRQKGFGGTQPIFKNDSEENRSRNRRVEFRILKI